MKHCTILILIAFSCLLLNACGQNNAENNNSLRITLSTETLSLKAGTSTSVMYSVISDSPQVSVSVLPVDGVETTVKPSGDGKMGEIFVKALPGSEGGKSLTAIASDGTSVNKATITIEIEKSSKKLKSMKLDDGGDYDIVFEYDNNGQLILAKEQNGLEVIEYQVKYDGQSIKIICPELSSIYLFQQKDGLIFEAVSNTWAYTWEYDEHRHLQKETRTYLIDSSSNKSITSYYWEGDDCIRLDDWQTSIIEFGNDIDPFGISGVLMFFVEKSERIELFMAGMISDWAYPPRSQHLPIRVNQKYKNEEDIWVIQYEYDSDGYPISVILDIDEYDEHGVLHLAYYE